MPVYNIVPAGIIPFIKRGKEGKRKGRKDGRDRETETKRRDEGSGKDRREGNPLFNCVTRFLSQRFQTEAINKFFWLARDLKQSKSPY